MAGWNVAVTQLVVGQVIHKISILEYLISANCILFLNGNDEHAKCLNVWFCFCCMVTMYACFISKHFSFYVCMFMGLVARIVNRMVVSSSSFGGLGMLQCGIRAHFAAWASMGHEESVTEASYPLSNSRRNEKMTGKFLNFFLSVKIIRWLRLKPIGYVR